MDVLAPPPPQWRLEAWRQDLYDALLGLPHDPIALAMKFADLGIRGYPGNTTHCPLALYLDRVPYTECSVSEWELHARPRADTPLTHSDAFELALHPWPLVMPMPHHLRVFVRQFDAGHFPMLLAF